MAFTVKVIDRQDADINAGRASDNCGGDTCSCACECFVGVTTNAVDAAAALHLSPLGESFVGATTNPVVAGAALQLSPLED